MKREEYPVSALRFNAAVEIEQATESEPAKVRMLARSAQPIEHWFWGTIVHDNSGAKFKDSIPLDYCHLDTEVIGFANSSDIRLDESQNLTVDGQLTPFKDDDRASEILAKSKMGVPYEASINFAGDGVKIERVRDGESTEVNGYQFEGPGVVVREWPLRGIAVCPYGADGNTKSEFSSSETIAVSVIEGEQMSDEVQTSEAVENEVENTAAEAPKEASEMSVDPRAEAKRFVEAFGDAKGGAYFAADLSFEEATAKHLTYQEGRLKEKDDEIAKLNAEIEHLKNSSGEVVPANVTEEQGKNGLASRFKIAGFDN